VTRGISVAIGCCICCASCGRIGFQDVEPADGRTADGETAASQPAADAPIPAIAAMQVMSNNSTTTSNSLTLAAPVQDHDAVIVCFTTPSASSTLQSISDTLGNTYTIAGAPVVSNGFVHYIAFASSPAGGSDTVTVTLSAAGAWTMVALEYGGLALSAPFDTAAHDSGSGSAMTSGSASTSSAHELLLAYAHASGPMIGPGFTMRYDGNSSLVEDQVMFGSGSYTATGPNTPAGIWTLLLATFSGR
jgi:hypothetical protein